MPHICKCVCKFGRHCQYFIILGLKDVKNWGFQGFWTPIMRLSTSPIEKSYQFNHCCVQIDHLYQTMPDLCKCVSKFGRYCQYVIIPQLKDVKNWGFQGFWRLIMSLSARPIEISHQFQHWCVQFDQLYQNMSHLCNHISKLGCNCQSFTLPHLKDVKNWFFQVFWV